MSIKSIPKKLWFIFFIFLTISSAAFFYIFSKSVTRVEIGLKWVNQAQFAGFFTADSRKIYHKYGLEVVFREFNVETDQLQDLVEGVTDFALTSPEEYLLARDKGAPIMAVAAFYQISPMAIVSLQGSHIKTPADLSGKVLGIKGGKTEEKITYESLLKSVGLVPSNVHFKTLGLGQREMDDLLQKLSDTVNVYRTDQLYFFDREKVAYNIIYPEQFGVNIINDILVARNDFIQKNPLIVKNFIRASVDGWKEVLLNPKNAVKDTLKYTTDKNYQNYDYQLYILNQSLPLIRPLQADLIGSMNFSQWNVVYQQMKQRGLLQHNFDVNELFSTLYLP